MLLRILYNFKRHFDKNLERPEVTGPGPAPVPGSSASRSAGSGCSSGTAVELAAAGSGTCPWSGRSSASEQRPDLDQEESSDPVVPAESSDPAA